MKNILPFLAIALLVVFSSCSKEKEFQEAAPEKIALENSDNLKGLKAAGQGNQQSVRNFRAHLSGKEEVPANDSRATGQAIFQLSKDGTELRYKLIVANIQNVTQAHIHRAPAGANGPVIVWLYPSAPPSELIPGRTSGVLAEGVITGDDLVGQLAGEELSALIDEIKAGNTYVNVHTQQFPPGEVRGQILGNARGN
jgi:hypothetical protein